VPAVDEHLPICTPLVASKMRFAASFVLWRYTVLVMRRCQVSLLVKRYFCYRWCLFKLTSAVLWIVYISWLSVCKWLTRANNDSSDLDLEQTERLVTSVKLLALMSFLAFYAAFLFARNEA